MAVLEIEGVDNFRDVGGLTAQGGVVRHGVLFRSGQLSGLTPRGITELQCRVRHIVDLRGHDELLAEPTQIKTPSTTYLPLFLGSTLSFIRADTTLGDLYLRLVEECGERLVEAIRIIGRGVPTLVHCTIGKDRTGVTIALALAAVGTARAEIVADYAATESALPVERTQRIAAYLRSVHPDALHVTALTSQSPAYVMRELLEYIDERWGSAADYLLAHGLKMHELRALHTVLVEPDNKG